MKAFTLALSSLVAAVSAVSITEINGNKFLSSYNNQDVKDVTGIVTAKGPDGIWMRQTRRSCKSVVSDGIYVYGSAFAKNASLLVGDVITINGKVSEYRSSAAYLYLTEIVSPVMVATLARGKIVKPLVIGQDIQGPPTKEYTSLDNGDVFGVPNAQANISVVNPVLQPSKYGLDYWESLVGQLVTVKSAHSVSKPNQFGDTWVVGTWAVTGENGRKGLTITRGDANPEAIIVGTPLDGSKNSPDTLMGDQLEDITGVVSYAFGFYRILPLTKVTVTSSPSPALPPPTTLTSDGKCSGLTVGQYNIENFQPGDTAHVQDVAQHIVTYQKTPDLMFLQEVQDDNGATNNGVVSSDVTLTALTTAIKNLGGPQYNYTYIAPVNGQDGGQPGGNIRNAYLFKPDVIRLRYTAGQTQGGSTDKNEVLAGPTLKYNPGRIDPTNVAFTASRKPLAAEWETVDGKSTLFTINVHFGSKGGSSSLHGDARPPINGGVADRQAQMQVTADFIAEILSKDASANVITAGDFNEFVFVKPVENFAAVSKTVDMDEVAGIAELERYSYVFDMNTQELDHMYVSKHIADGKPQYEHLHVNTWVKYSAAVSDHDPAVAKMNICKA